MKGFGIAATIAAALLAFVPAAAAEELTELVPGTAVLLANTGSGGGGSGGNTKNTSSATNIFSPASYVDYKRFGGEPTVTVDRYPFMPGQFHCPVAATQPCPPKDIVYQTAPIGLPTYSEFFKSDDLGATFRIPFHVPIYGSTPGTVGGGDSHQVVGHVTHKVYFVDLPAACITMNVSHDLGETFVTDVFGCGANPGVDDRQWVDEDEAFGPTACPPGAAPPIYCGNVYVDFIQFSTTAVGRAIIAARSQHGAAPGSFVTDSVCNTATMTVGSVLVSGVAVAPAPDALPTPCPNPVDPTLRRGGPITVDKSPTSPHYHDIYIPFFRLSGTWKAYIAKSDDGAQTWRRHLVADLGTRTLDPQNIFPQLAIDRAGNLYWTWSQTQPGVPTTSPGFGGEQDVHYTFSTDGGLTWAPPINLTKENNDSAIFPWMVAGDAGRVDLTYYKANTGLNSNVSFIDAEGNPCPSASGCRPNPTVWNTYFAQSMNALNTGPNFKSVQVTAQPNHIGAICTFGSGCSADRDLLDFITIDVDSLGAAHIAYSDDHVRRNTDTRDRMTRQLSGSSVFKNQTINLLNEWPVKDHRVTDRAGDVFGADGLPRAPCPGMDVLGATADSNNDTITIGLTLNGPPSAAAAIGCGGGIAATGGIWGAEFWAATSEGGADQANQFYIAYRDNPPDGAPGFEAGVVDNLNLTITTMEFRPTDQAFPGDPTGTCFTATPPVPCTITMWARKSDLGIKPGDGLYQVSGLSLYFFGSEQRPPLLRVQEGNSEQADATATFHIDGTGTTKTTP